MTARRLKKRASHCSPNKIHNGALHLRKNEGARQITGCTTATRDCLFLGLHKITTVTMEETQPHWPPGARTPCSLKALTWTLTLAIPLIREALDWRSTCASHMRAARHGRTAFGEKKRTRKLPRILLPARVPALAREFEPIDLGRYLQPSLHLRKKSVCLEERHGLQCRTSPSTLLP